MDVSSQDFVTLKSLEEGLWQAEVRFDLGKMDDMLAEDFFEYGRSGRVYQRADTLAVPAQAIPAVMPLVDLQIRLIDRDVAQVTYTSILNYPDGKACALRSSIWSRTKDGWKIRFHQGTPSR